MNDLPVCASISYVLSLQLFVCAQSLKLNLHLLWSPAIALAIAKTIVFRGCFPYFIFFQKQIFRRCLSDIFETLPLGVALSAIEALL